jgi:hypothetical protein
LSLEVHRSAAEDDNCTGGHNIMDSHDVAAEDFYKYLEFEHGD